MKRLFMLIGLLIVHLSYSQTTNITESQKKIIKTFTAEDYIEWSKAISNEKEQSKAIKSLESKIDSLKSIYNNSYNNFNLLIEESKAVNDSLLIKNKELIINYDNKEEELFSMLSKEKWKKWYVLLGAIITIILVK